jgi:hypothetical protein
MSVSAIFAQGLEVDRELHLSPQLPQAFVSAASFHGHRLNAHRAIIPTPV